MIVTLGDISSNQSKATHHTYDEVIWLLNYASLHLNAKIGYNSSDMVPWVHSNTSYLYVTKSRRQSGGQHYLSSSSNNPQNNGAIHAVWKIW